MPDDDFAADRAAFDAIVRDQLADFGLGLSSDRRVEVGQRDAGIIDHMVSDIEEAGELCDGFDAVKDDLLRNLWIRRDDED